jgi:hypothetical protein
MKIIILGLIVCTLLFMGCCGPVTTNGYDYENDIMDHNTNLNKITYCYIYFDENEMQEYYFGENEAVMIVTKDSYVNKALINKQQHCINSQEHNANECYPIEESGGYQGILHGWNMAKAFGTCSELEYDSKYFEID